MLIESKQDYLQFAILLAIITVFYNVFEGIVSIYFGLADDTLALFGFGLDSFVEVVSGIGIWHMVLRIIKNGDDNQDNFEKTALKITGTAFYFLAMGLLISSIYNIINQLHPKTTLWGIVVSTISIFVMWWLIYNKRKVGTAIASDAILADAHCTRVCMQLSFVLLIASLGYEVLNINSIDAVGSLIIAGISFKEGNEAFKKASNRSSCC